MTDSKITPEAKARCAAHSLQEQLEQYRAMQAVELAIARKRFRSHDQDDVVTAFEGDKECPAFTPDEIRRAEEKGKELSDFFSQRCS